MGNTPFVVLIPARLASSRLPNKPLADLAGLPMVVRVAMQARQSQAQQVVVAADDEAIVQACKQHGIEALLTRTDHVSGSDRLAEAANLLGLSDDALVVNVQGDAPFTAPAHIVDIMRAARASGRAVTTPVVRLGWADLDRLRAAKLNTPASGTTCVVGPDGRALWFSKAILPMMRKEDALRASEPLSPVLQHIGLYCYRPAALRRFEAAPESAYEQLEGLEQLRLIALGIDIHAVVVAPAAITMSGVDSPADVERAERLIAERGDPFIPWRD